MTFFLISVIWIAFIAVIIAVLRGYAMHDRTLQRLSQAAATKEVEGFSSAPKLFSTVQAPQLRRHWRWLPWLFAFSVAITLWVMLDWAWSYVVATSLVVGLLLSQFENFFAKQYQSRLENQLADVIDILVGALSAGAGLGAAIESALNETKQPLRSYLADVVGRIRLGDDPVTVFRSLSEKIPVETFLLFSSALSVHWEVGGRLAPTLATVGRTIRDRIEIDRRIQSNIAQSQFSTFAIIGLIYFIALIVWRNGPDAMHDFVTSSVGSWFVAASIILQAVGIFWMDVISRPKF